MSDQPPSTTRSNRSAIWILCTAGVLGIGALLTFTLARNRKPALDLPPIDLSVGLQEAYENGDWTLSEETRGKLLAMPLEFETKQILAHEATPAHVLEGSSNDRQATERQMIPELANRPGEKLVVTGEEFNQFFSAYITQEHPVFITTDSILNAFHTLFEDSFISLECMQLEQLPNLLASTREKLRQVEAEQTPELHLARNRALIVLGVAHQLVDSRAIREADDELQRVIDDEVEAVRAAEGVRKPAWLGINDPSFVGIDYSQYRPVSFYTQASDLEDYYRAVRWLQSIPFRIDVETEFASFMLIVSAARSANADGWKRLGTAYKDFFGEPDDWDLVKGFDAFPEGSPTLDALRNLQQILRADTDAPGRMSDLRRYPFGDLEYAASFRVLSGYRLPDSALLERTTDVERFGFRLPAGLELCVALGSEFARTHLPEQERNQVLEVIDQNRGLLEGRSIYAEYLNCLRALLAIPPQGAPAFMSDAPWQAKCCQTALGGWAQLRHTTALQSKSWAGYENGATRTVRGFIEPNPEFYRRLKALSERVRAAVATSDPKQSARARAKHLVTALLRKSTFLAALNQARQQGLDRSSIKDRADEETEFFTSLVFEIGHAIPFYSIKNTEAKSANPLHIDGNTAILCALVQIQRELESDKQPLDQPWQTLVDRLEVPTDKQWEKLVELCDKLANYSQAQLEGKPFSADMDQFLKEYGDKLADLQLYEYHAGTEPRDDAMRVANILNSPMHGQLHVAVGRPRAMYVLYLYEGKEILCRGAVMPYYEFLHLTPLTDSEWRQLHDSPSRPALPNWLQPIYAK